MIIDLSKWNDRIQTALISIILSASSIRLYNAYTLKSALVYHTINISLVLCSVIFLCINISKLVVPVLVEMTIAGVVILNYILYENNRLYIRNTFKDCYMYLLIIILCIYVADKDIIENAMIRSAYCVFVFDILIFCTPVYRNLLTKYEYGGVHAVYSYSLLFPSVIFMYMAGLKKRKIMIIPALISASIMFLYGGNRMAMVSFIFYSFYTLSKVFRQKKGSRKIFFFGVVVIAMVIMAGCFKTVLEHMLEYGKSSKLTFRVAEFLFEKKFLFSQGRNEIFSVLGQKALSWNGIIGYGISGDRLLTVTHEYAHNIFLEFIIEFGWINGGLISAGFIISLAYQLVKNNEYRELVIVCIALKILPLMVSGSFWDGTFFWIYISICMKRLRVMIPGNNIKDK